MLTNAIIFKKTQPSENINIILFALTEKLSFLEFDLAKTSPTDFANKNKLIRHDNFDWHVNKKTQICFLFETTSSSENFTDNFLSENNNNASIEWHTFPQAIKKIVDGKKRNLLQLAVQYISHGAVDESVIAADYDEEWIKKILLEQT